MKILSLNLWGGKLYEPLIEFIHSQSGQVDIFCFQEVFSTASGIAKSGDARVNVFQEIESILPEFTGYFASQEENIDMAGRVNIPTQYGLASFVRKSLPLTDTGDFFVYGERNCWQPAVQGSQGRNLQYLEFNLLGKQLTIANLHGLWTGDGKGDTESRIEQSHLTKEFLDAQEGETILCGDFNLLPDTKSLVILEKGMRNLIQENNITSTRSHLYLKENKFADYMLLSEGLRVNGFKVLPDPVSDHLALLLDFTL